MTTNNMQSEEKPAAAEARQVAKNTVKEARRELRLPVSLLVAGIFCLIIAACASKDDRPNAAKEKTISTSLQPKQKESEPAAVTEITFGKGKSILSAEAQSKLRNLLILSGARALTLKENNKSVPKIESVKVISWSDSDFPSLGTDKLSKQARKVAQDRNDTISAFIKKEGRNVSVETFNMAERPNVLQDFFAADDVSIKKSLETLGIPQISSEGSASTAAAPKLPSKASKSIVMVVLKR